MWVCTESTWSRNKLNELALKCNKMSINFSIEVFKKIFLLTKGALNSLVISNFKNESMFKIHDC